MCTLSRLQQHPRAMIVADEDATLELQVKTVKASTMCRKDADGKLTSSSVLYRH